MAAVWLAVAKAARRSLFKKLMMMDGDARRALLSADGGRKELVRIASDC